MHCTVQTAVGYNLWFHKNQQNTPDTNHSGEQSSANFTEDNSVKDASSHRDQILKFSYPYASSARSKEEQAQVNVNNDRIDVFYKKLELFYKNSFQAFLFQINDLIQTKLGTVLA